ncbi:hypothetical protein LUZ60_016976 [Juncus effusus]|nr:hypothetical protein LUZ60_016976 [Juncus effusus]
MKGSLCHEYETGIPAREVWKVYGGLRLGELFQQLLPDLCEKVELDEGDGGVGTVLRVTFAPGIGMEYYKEKFTKIDNENYVKEAMGVEGGVLDLGFLSHLIRLEILPKGDDSSVIRSTIEYETDDKQDVDPSIISTDALAMIAESVTKYIKDQHNNPVEGKRIIIICNKIILILDMNLHVVLILDMVTYIIH